MTESIRFPALESFSEDVYCAISSRRLLEIHGINDGISLGVYLVLSNGGRAEYLVNELEYMLFSSDTATELEEQFSSNLVDLSEVRFEGKFDEQIPIFELILKLLMLLGAGDTRIPLPLLKKFSIGQTVQEIVWYKSPGIDLELAAQFGAALGEIQSTYKPSVEYFSRRLSYNQLFYRAITSPGILGHQSDLADQLELILKESESEVAISNFFAAKSGLKLADLVSGMSESILLGDFLSRLERRPYRYEDIMRAKFDLSTRAVE
jgi:hypothetical protein